MTFELFDPQGELRVTRGALPHWYQPGVTYFVTFRTADSVPADLMRCWHNRRDDWLRRHGIEPSHDGWQSRLGSDPQLQRDFDHTFTRQFMAYLDRGIGECVLRRQEFATIVSSSLRYADGSRYTLGDFVVMPNHVHVLVGLRGDTDIVDLCSSWKHFTGHEINRTLARSGRFWHEESFDHLVRTPESFDRLRRYIAENPRKARLKPKQFLLSSSL